MKQDALYWCDILTKKKKNHKKNPSFTRKLRFFAKIFEKIRNPAEDRF